MLVIFATGYTGCLAEEPSLDSLFYPTTSPELKLSSFLLSYNLLAL